MKKAKLKKIIENQDTIINLLMKNLPTDTVGIDLDKLEEQPLFETDGPSEEKTAKLKVGKWYKGQELDLKFLWFVTSICDDEFNGYGFLNNVFIEEKILYSAYKNVKWASENLIIATVKEVETALIAEAKRRYKPGQLVFDTWSKTEIKIDQLERFDMHYRDVLTVFTKNNSKIFLMVGGKWAEIISEPENEIDWSKPWQPVKNSECGCIMLILKNLNNDKFLGTKLFNGLNCNSHVPIGMSTIFSKKYFIPYNGEPITL